MITNKIDPALFLEAKIENYQDKQGNIKRAKLPLEWNETPAFVPEIFLEISKGESSPDLRKKVETLCDPNRIAKMALGDVIKALRQDIYLHVELRIQLFFQQLLISYKSGLEFAYFPTHLQAGLEAGRGSRKSY